MGGHGALSLYLRQFHPSLAPSPPSPSASATSFKAASAFAPICHPSACPWGKKAFGGYLRSVDEWAAYDSLLLLPSKAEEPPTSSSSSSSATAAELHIKISYGTQDQFYKDGQLLPEAFEARARELGWAPDAVRVDREEGYDHSYYFVSPPPSRALRSLLIA
jgi:S-formylglutathione hydrolase